jgi:hypothetical protein
MVKDELELYILYSNGLMKQFSSYTERECDTAHIIDLEETGKIFNLVAIEKKV